MQPHLLVLAFVGGFIVSIYPKYAPRKGWRVHPTFRRSGGMIMSLGFASMAGAAIFLVVGYPWWMALLLIAAGVASGLALMHFLKSLVQSAALALIAFSWLWLVLVSVRL